MTKYELSWGAHGVISPTGCEFTAPHGNDAVTRFAEKVVELDRNPDVSAGWVHLKQTHPDRLMAWTKTSDESPTSEGNPISVT